MSEQSSFLKRHGFVIAGVVLPILVVIAFVVARTLPRFLVDAPRYDVVYSSLSAYTDEPRNVGCYISCVDGRLRARWSRAAQPVYSPTVRVYRLNPASGVVSEITVPEPANLAALDGTQDLFLGGLDGVRIDISPRAPDGYEFESTYSGGGGPFGGLFSGSSRGPRSTIKKNGHIIQLPRTNPIDYGYDQVTFIGWAIPVEGGR